MKEYNEWAFCVGNFILNFGMLDMHIFEFLEHHLSAEDFEKSKADPLKVRLKTVGKLVGRGTEKRVIFDSLVQRLEPFRLMRNHIAHGHMVALMRPRENGVKLVILKSKELDASSQSAEPIDFDQLVEAAKIVCDISEEMRNFFGLYGETKVHKVEQGAALPEIFIRVNE